MNEDQMAENMAKGRGIGPKEPFKTVGTDKSDRETNGDAIDDKRGRGRPSPDKTWTKVGKDSE